MGWESSDMVRFDLRPLLQGQMRIAQLKNDYNSLFIGPRYLQYGTTLYSKSSAGNLLICSGLTLGPFFKLKRV